MFTELVVLISLRPFRVPSPRFDVISEAQKEMAQSDILVCGKCHSVFHFIDLFKEHKNNNCKRISAFNDCVSKISRFPSRKFKNSKIILARDPTENLGLPLVEADAVQVVGERGGQPVEALQDVDELGGDHPTVVAGGRGNDSVFRTRKSQLMSKLASSLSSCASF